MHTWVAWRRVHMLNWRYLVVCVFEHRSELGEQIITYTDNVPWLRRFALFISLFMLFI